MLAPGDYLINPQPPEKPAAPPPVAGADAAWAREPAPRLTPPAREGEPEHDSFLLILLRALGAIHT
jgi:hypothetical protein